MLREAISLDGYTGKDVCTRPYISGSATWKDKMLHFLANGGCAPMKIYGTSNNGQGS